MRKISSVLGQGQKAAIKPVLLKIDDIDSPRSLLTAYWYSMAIQINSPHNGATVGCSFELRVYCTTERFTIKMTPGVLNVGQGRQCKPTKLLERKCRIVGVPDDPKGRRPNNRNSNYSERISWCDFFQQACLYRGASITITVTDASGNSASVTVTLSRNCDCPRHQ